MNKIRIGIIGFGYWGSNLARNSHDASASALLAIADVKDDRLQRAQALYPGTYLVKILEAAQHSLNNGSTMEVILW